MNDIWIQLWFIDELRTVIGIGWKREKKILQNLNKISFLGGSIKTKNFVNKYCFKFKLFNRLLGTDICYQKVFKKCFQKNKKKWHILGKYESGCKPENLQVQCLKPISTLYVLKSCTLTRVKVSGTFIGIYENHIVLDLWCNFVAF